MAGQETEGPWEFAGSYFPQERSETAPLHDAGSSQSVRMLGGSGQGWKPRAAPEPDPHLCTCQLCDFGQVT